MADIISNVSNTRALSLDAIHRVAPSVFAQAAHASRSDRYVEVPTFDILDRLHQQGFVVTDAQQTKTRDKSRREFTKHLLVLQHSDAGELAGEGRPQILLTNSFDGSSSFQLRGGFFRFVCSNGIVVGESVADTQRIRHQGNRELILDNVIEGTFKIVESLDKASERILTFKGINASRDQQRELAERAADLRWGRDDNGNSKAPLYQVDDLLRARRFEDRTDDAWTVINRIQENVIRGGLPGRTASGKRTRTRAVNGIDQNIGFNEQLWNAAEEVFA